MVKAATRGHLRPLGKSGHLRPLEWLRVAAFSEIQIPRPRVEGGHLRPLDRAATCGHLRPLEWLQVAAFLKFKYRAECNPNGHSFWKNINDPYFFSATFNFDNVSCYLLVLRISSETLKECMNLKKTCNDKLGGVNITSLTFSLGIGTWPVFHLWTNHGAFDGSSLNLQPLTELLENTSRHAKLSKLKITAIKQKDKLPNKQTKKINVDNVGCFYTLSC